MKWFVGRFGKVLWSLAHSIFSNALLAAFFFHFRHSHKTKSESHRTWEKIESGKQRRKIYRDSAVIVLRARERSCKLLVFYGAAGSASFGPEPFGARTLLKHIYIGIQSIHSPNSSAKFGKESVLDLNLKNIFEKKEVELRYFPIKSSIANTDSSDGMFT